MGEGSFFYWCDWVVATSRKNNWPTTVNMEACHAKGQKIVNLCTWKQII